MSLIQSYKTGPASGTAGSAQRLMERLSPSVSQAVQEVFDPVLDRVVLEDRALMELLAKVPEDQVRLSRLGKLCSIFSYLGAFFSKVAGCQEERHS